MNNFVNYNPYLANKTVLFSGFKEEKEFRKNLKRQPKDWIYRKKNITYSYNEQRFREKPFNEINWKESVVILGCSNVEGLGLAEEDTISKQLEKIIKRPVVNLGISGSGIDVACWNSTILHEYYEKPKAVVHIWSSLDRYADKLRNQEDMRIYLPGDSNEYVGKLNWEYRSQKYVETDRALWKNKAIYYEASFFTYTAEQLKTDLCQYKDNARDLIHPGIESAKAAAEKIAENLIKQGL